ncbi:MAG: hypothetical protein Q8O92_13190 [Candidatus Latescibacter sp.]|nr:hypothetical protein [Candidatus Latescibacter sp.]
MKRRTLLKLISMALYGAAGLPETCPAGVTKPLGLQYLEKMRQIFEKIKSTQSEEMLEASYRIADTIKKGKKCHRVWETGHSVNNDFWPNRPGDTNIFENKTIPYEKDDLLLANRGGGSGMENNHKKGVFIIGGCTPWGGSDIQYAELLLPEVQSLKICPYADIWIETFDTAYGAFIHVPGETAPLGPVTGALGMMTFWIMMSDTARILARDAVSFAVYGDEPPIGGTKFKANLSRPLGELYYDTALQQHKAIEDEFVSINEIATMAVHAVLTGGRVYCYSRYEDALCLEAVERRAGLALTYGLWGPPDNIKIAKYTIVDRVTDEKKVVDEAFKPTGNDIVIMGTAYPDNAEDIECLELFKKSGMGTAVIGPTTRNGIVPDGRTVCKEADVHVGAGCDSYGLFALPGIQRKVSPTSGLIQNQIFWAICGQIAEQIVERTGNAPGIFLNGGLKGGMEKLVAVRRTFRQRGY